MDATDSASAMPEKSQAHQQARMPSHLAIRPRSRPARPTGEYGRSLCNKSRSAQAATPPAHNGPASRVAEADAVSTHRQAPHGAAATHGDGRPIAAGAIPTRPTETRASG